MPHFAKSTRPKGIGRTISSGISHPAYRHGTKGVETEPISPRTIDSSGGSSCFETKANPPSTTQSSPASELAEPAPLSKGRTTVPLFPTASVSARFLLEHGIFGFRRKGPEWECARRPKRLLWTRMGFHGFVEAMEGSRRSLWIRLRSIGCPSPCLGTDARSSPSSPLALLLQAVGFGI